MDVIERDTERDNFMTADEAAAYGLVAYQTAYLKVKYPKAFMAALLTSVIGDVTKTVIYINECARLSINVLSPNFIYDNIYKTTISISIIDHKKVILSHSEAGCPMAEQLTVEELKELKKQHSDCHWVRGTWVSGAYLSCHGGSRPSSHDRL